jgi:hypothetical protein
LASNAKHSKISSFQSFAAKSSIRAFISVNKEFSAVSADTFVPSPEAVFYFLNFVQSLYFSFSIHKQFKYAIKNLNPGGV